MVMWPPSFPNVLCVCSGTLESRMTSWVPPGNISLHFLFASTDLTREEKENVYLGHLAMSLWLNLTYSRLILPAGDVCDPSQLRSLALGPGRALLVRFLLCEREDIRSDPLNTYKIVRCIAMCCISSLEEVKIHGSLELTGQPMRDQASKMESGWLLRNF